MRPSVQCPVLQDQKQINKKISCSGFDYKSMICPHWTLEGKKQRNSGDWVSLDIQMKILGREHSHCPISSPSPRLPLLETFPKVTTVPRCHFPHNKGFYYSFLLADNNNQNIVSTRQYN
jgi:hypothetical protein